jgi:hypothetical protein
MATTHNFDSGESFYQREPLTARLKNLIHDYPEGVGILKELIQNADDAGATKIEVIIDWREHCVEKLPDPEMKALLGPSILVYNDAVFTNNDFNSIQNLGVSGKREDLQKTGRFGVGFNSVYHVTDYPNFISRDRIIFFDPTLSAIPHISDQEPGRSWNLAQSQWWDNYPEFMQIYEIGGLKPGTTEFSGTLFRLSLRTPEQAQRSEIRQQPFGADNIQELLTELENNANELLLFLKSLVEVRVRQVNPDGSSEELITIVTHNATEVLSQRRQLQSALQGGLTALMEQCQAQQLPKISYLHTIQTTTPQTQTTTQWRVCSLLRADEQGDILQTIVQLAEQGQKAIPWAGAAACLSRTSSSGVSESLQLAGRAYCFLPLPQMTGLPVHVNGFFDLDSSRRELTNDDLTGRDRIRVTWNKLLIRHVLAHAYANLMMDLVQDMGNDAPTQFYQFFPVTANGGLKDLPHYVLQQLYDQPVIRSGLSAATIDQDSTDPNLPWITPKAIHLLPQNWQDLVEPLSADLLAIAHPPIPQVLQNAFSKAGLPLPEYTPTQLRAHLTIQQPLACEIADAPKVSLRQREWIIRLLQYCLHDRCRNVHHLPLAILADGKLHNFSKKSHEYPYTADADLRHIFANYPEWFLDADLIKQVPIVSECQGVRAMTPTEFAERLREVIDPQKAGKIEWQPEGLELPNTIWLAQVYQYLVNLSEPLPLPQLATIPLVPGNDGYLHRPQQSSTPLCHDSSSGQEMLETLTYFSVAFVQAEAKLQQAITAFLKRHPETLIGHLTAPDLVEALGDIATFPEYHSQHHPSLIHFLVKERSSLDRRQIDRLQSLPIYLTNHGQLSDLRQVYLPGGYEPPTIAASVKLLCLGEAKDGQEWKPLFQTLKVPELSRARLILDYLIPTYASLSTDNQRIALTWMRDHFHQAQKSYDEPSQGADLRQTISTSALIYCNDGQLRPATKVYLPSSYPVVHKILGDRAFMPDMNFYHEDKALWEHFFITLETLQTPSADDLILHIDQLISIAAEQGVEAVASTLKEIFEHIVQHWDTLSTATLQKSKTPFSHALKSRAWLPPERQPEKLAKFPGHYIPHNQLYRPEQIVFRRDALLVASQKPIFNIASSEIARTTLSALGFIQIQAIDVVQHFKVLIALDDTSRQHIDAKTWQQSLRDIYKFLGENCKQQANQNWLKQELAGLKCLWDGELWSISTKN